MFTGLIEEVGKVENIQRTSNFGRIVIRAKTILDDIKIGDSIAVNGTCLTAVEFTSTTFTAEAMRETLEKTNLGNLKIGSVVNLERALLPTTRLGGHFVSGHVDGQGILSTSYSDGPAKILEFNAPPSLLKQMVPKGSIAIDGISLTLIDVTPSGFSVGIIPHTQDATTLTHLTIGNKVNLETDVLAKYCQKMIIEKSSKKENMIENLEKLGF